MPKVDLKFSSDINLDTISIFDTIEKVINQFDEKAGACKSRAYPAAYYKHTHVLISISLLKKIHRDEDFMQKLLHQLKSNLIRFIPSNCYYAIDLFFIGDYYFTDYKK